ncbi:thiamine-phosphate kinase [Candidatus Poribacteria bacterium]|nr:thiamine-phosphate kinase [Candidatus Poribacteria bacterium]
MLIREIGEFNLIERMSKALSSSGRNVIVGIGDDTAVLPFNGDKLQLVTTDMLIQDVHFRTTTATPEQIGWKSLAANISDIAAMGGEPTYAFISIGLPKTTTVEFVDKFYSGMNEIAKLYSVDIAGGDTVSSPQVIINIALLGEVNKDNLILRSGAEVGDAVMVTGDLGGSMAGLEILEHKLTFHDTEKHLKPIPRVNEGVLLARSGWVTSMIDVSDGLASEINHICKMSKTGASIQMKSIPLSQNVRQVSDIIGKNPYDFALFGGEDYELVFTCKPDKVQELKDMMDNEGNAEVTELGCIEDADKSVKIKDISGKIMQLSSKGYDHFV